MHTTAAPLFMVLWPFFTDRPCARFFAAAVINASRFCPDVGAPKHQSFSMQSLLALISSNASLSST